MLELKNINVSFRSERQDKIFGHTRQQVLFDVSLAVKEGTCLGILGESGSGKSTMGRVLCGLLKPDSGEAVLDGVSVYASRAGRQNLQNKLSIVFQDYTTSANPRFRIRDIIGEGLTVQERREGKKLDRKAETSRLLELVGLPADFADRFPHELSGGQLQRVCIARAVACKPEIAKVMELQNQESTGLPIYEKQLKETEVGITNMLNAIQMGILTSSTKERLEALEEQRKELQARIAEERLAKPKMKEEFVRFWLLRFRKLDMTQPEQRQALVDTFINAIYLYDDKVLITFNYEDAKKQTLVKMSRIYDEILIGFQTASAVLHPGYTNLGTFSRKGALQSGVV